MVRTPSFAYSHAIEDVADPLGAILQGADPSVLRLVTDIVDMLRDRDHDVEDAFTTSLSGQKDKTTITATAGGATITFASAFSRTPVILVANPNGSGGYTATVVDASISTSSFKVQIFNGTTEITTGTYKVPWVAL